MVNNDATKVTPAKKETLKAEAAKVVAKAETKVSETEKKAEEKAATVKKAVAEKKATTTKAAKKVVKTAKKAVAKAEPAEQVFLQYEDGEATIADITNKVKEQFVSEGHRASNIKSVRIYLKPEERAAYYVINDKNAGRVDLF
ncbi:MAG: DUF6465 family protein [Lachnospiraceae bacterium]|nr:DUF6465 family protein [Lachnospiraceae bacterium]